MLKPTIYGFADPEDVETALRKRLTEINTDKKEELAHMLGEAMSALFDINSSIPVHNKSRHLVANSLEILANGSKAQNTRPESPQG